MSKDFRIYQNGDRQIIERLSYPRFRGLITFSGDLSDIEEIEVNEDILEAGDFLINYKPTGDE